MPVNVKLIAIVLFAVVLSPFHFSSFAADYTQIVVPDGAQNDISLKPGDSVVYSGADAAIVVTGSNASFSADKISVSAASVGNTRPQGVLVQTGGTATLSNSSVSTSSTFQGAHALKAVGQGSEIIGDNLNLSTFSLGSYGASAENGGKISLRNGGAITSTGISGGLHATGLNSTVLANGISISGVPNVVFAERGGLIKLENVTVQLQGTNSGVGLIRAKDMGSRVELKDSTINNEWRAIAVQADGGAHVELDTVTIHTNGDAVQLHAPTGMSGSTALVKNSKLFINGSSYGLNINGNYASAIVENSSIEAKQGRGAWLAGANTSLKASNFSIESLYAGIDSRGGGVTLDQGSVTTLGNNAHALYMSVEKAGARSFTATGVTVETRGNSAVGALARLSGARVNLNSSNVTTRGAGSHGLYATGNNVVITASGTTVDTLGAGSSGAVVNNQAQLALDNSQLRTTGAGSHGVWSYFTVANAAAPNQITLAAGSGIDTQDGTALLATGGDHVFDLSKASVTTRASGAESQGLFLHSRPVTVTNGGVSTDIETGLITLRVDNSAIKGDVLMESGTAEISLSNNSVLSGALREQGNSHVTHLSVDDTSVWQVRGNSSVQHLDNQGQVAFLPPTQGGFKTIRTNEYDGGGSLALNTRLGGDNSETDKLIIDGGPITGTTGVRVVNAGGGGGQTEQGILVIEALNGASTVANSFQLHGASSGYRASTDTVAASGYDYSLLRGGTGGEQDSWYLVSKHVEVPVDPTPVDPDPVDPTPVDPKPPVGPSHHNVSPEVGAYIGNQLAARRLFSHQLRDRTPYIPQEQNTGLNVWTRVEAGREKEISMRDGRMSISTKRAVIQLGGDFLQRPLGTAGTLHVGWMGGYGEARTDSHSTFYVPQLRARQQVGAKGKATAYAAGVYGTFLANTKTNLGAYGDTWLQYSRVNNTLSSELGSVKYHANVWSASLEAGYGLQPFQGSDALDKLVITPNAQVIYSHYDADDAMLHGSRFRPDTNAAWQLRMGVRFAPLVHDAALADAKFRPFLELNWLRHDDNAVRIGGNTLKSQISRNVGEAKVGAEGWFNDAVSVSGHLFAQTGSDSQRAYGGMLSVRYQW